MLSITFIGVLHAYTLNDKFLERNRLITLNFRSTLKFWSHSESNSMHKTNMWGVNSSSRSRPQLLQIRIHRVVTTKFITTNHHKVAIFHNSLTFNSIFIWVLSKGSVSKNCDRAICFICYTFRQWVAEAHYKAIVLNCVVCFISHSAVTTAHWSQLKMKEHLGYRPQVVPSVSFLTILLPKVATVIIQQHLHISFREMLENK